jgi:hypothetical protein
MMLKAIDEIVGVFPRVAVIEGEGLEAGEADDWTCNGCIIASLQSSVVGMGRLIASGRASTR